MTMGRARASAARPAPRTCQAGFPSTPMLAAHHPRRPFARPGYRACGTDGFSGDRGSGPGAELNLPTAEGPGGVAVDAAGTR